MPDPKLTSKVLVVDDESDVRITIQTLLKDNGFSVEVAASGTEAISKVSAADFDVILLDIRMPQLDGLTTLKEIRKKRTLTEVIMLTAVDEANPSWEAQRLGASEYLIKPYKNEELVQKVRAAALRRQAKEEKGSAEDLLFELHARSMDGDSAARRAIGMVNTLIEEKKKKEDRLPTDEEIRNVIHEASLGEASNS